VSKPTSPPAPPGGLGGTLRVRTAPARENTWPSSRSCEPPYPKDDQLLEPRRSVRARNVDMDCSDCVHLMSSAGISSANRETPKYCGAPQLERTCARVRYSRSRARV